VIEAVLFDLDDTLFDQRTWLTGAWRAVAAVGAARGLDDEALLVALADIAAEGSAAGRIIDRALARLGVEASDVTPYVEAFRDHQPPRLPLYPGVADALARARARLPIGLVTDGEVRIQRAKLAALGLTDAFDVVVFSDALGRDRRKPHPAPFLTALGALGTEPARAVYVGDRPDKDVAGAIGAGLAPVRVRTGEYAAQPDLPAPRLSVAGVPEAVGAVLAWCESAMSVL